MGSGAESYRRYLKGDDDGLTELVRLYKDGLILYLNGYVSNIHIAEELTEETFFRLITKKPKFFGKSSFKTWLYSIARHVTLDHIRRHAREVTVPPEDLERCCREEETLERSYIKAEREAHLRKSMDTLCPEYRTVLWLVYFEGFSSQEAGRVLGKSPRQMKNLLYRAKQALKERLLKEGYENEEL